MIRDPIIPTRQSPPSPDRRTLLARMIAAGMTGFACGSGPSKALAQVVLSEDSSEIRATGPIPPPITSWQGFHAAGVNIKETREDDFSSRKSPTGKSQTNDLSRLSRSLTGSSGTITLTELRRETARSPLSAAGLPSFRGLWLYNPHTREETVDVFWRNGTYDNIGYSRICHLMRDWRQGVAVAMDPRLLHLLWIIQYRHGMDRPTFVNSGYRTVKTNNNLEGAAVHSFHLRGQANDIRVDGVSPSMISEYVHSLKTGGVGFYGNRFTHIDTGPIRSWNG